MSKRITIVDYGLGNLHSVHKALVQVADGWQVIISDCPDDIDTADKVVFPGVGAIGSCIDGLHERGLVEPLQQAATTKPMLAICVGYQALFAANEEDSDVTGLSILPGTVKRFPDTVDADGMRLKVPHMGWNQLHQLQKSPVWKGIDQNSWMYFVHSYYVESNDQSIVAATCEYGVPFAAVCIREQLIACQFHPEKSHTLGLRLLANFVKEL